MKSSKFSFLAQAMAVFLLTLSCALARAETCQFSSENCQYYLCKEKQLNCGDNGYLKYYGHYYCEAHIRNTPNMTEHGQRWIYAVRLCLQQRLEAITTRTTDCSEIHRQAIASHVQCYVQTGYCDLNFFDRLQAKAVASEELLRSGSISEGLSTLRQINQICESQEK